MDWVSSQPRRPLAGCSPTAHPWNSTPAGAQGPCGQMCRLSSPRFFFPRPPAPAHDRVHAALYPVPSTAQLSCTAKTPDPGRVMPCSESTWLSSGAAPSGLFPQSTPVRWVPPPSGVHRRGGKFPATWVGRSVLGTVDGVNGAAHVVGLRSNYGVQSSISSSRLASKSTTVPR